jgi:hypothetical protein
MSRAVAKSQRRQAVRELERDQKRAARARLLELRNHLKLAKRERVRRAREARAVCRAARKGARSRAPSIRAAHRAAAAAEIESLRRVARGTCETSQLRARERSAESVARAGAALDAEGAYQAQVLRAVKAPRVKREHVQAAALERARESDDEVRNNLPTELWPVWEARKGKTAPGRNSSRTEVFLDWAHNHSADVDRLISQDIDRQVKAWEREERALARGKSRETYAMEEAPF